MFSLPKFQFKLGFVAGRFILLVLFAGFVALGVVGADKFIIPPSANNDHLFAGGILGAVAAIFAIPAVLYVLRAKM